MREKTKKKPLYLGVFCGILLKPEGVILWNLLFRKHFLPLR